MVTEPVFASVANVLSGFDGIPSIQSVRLSELEVKHGITQVQHCRASHRQHAQLHHSSTALALRSGLVSPHCRALVAPLARRQASHLLP